MSYLVYFFQNGPALAPNGPFSAHLRVPTLKKTTESLTIWDVSPRFPVLVCLQARLCTYVHYDTHLREGLQTSISASKQDDFVMRLEPT